jgi:hypothetical protein
MIDPLADEGHTVNRLRECDGPQLTPAARARRVATNATCKPISIRIDERFTPRVLLAAPASLLSTPCGLASRSASLLRPCERRRGEGNDHAAETEGYTRDESDMLLEHDHEDDDNGTIG